MWVAAVVANVNWGQPVVRGWWTVADGDCDSILERNFGNVPSMEILLYAHTKNHQWPDKAHTWSSFCIGEYMYQRTNSGPYSCREDEKLRPFLRTVVNKDGDLFDERPSHTVHVEEFIR